MKKVFENPETFAAVNEAEKWCKDRGISVGLMQRDAPRALFIGDWFVPKWKDLDDCDKEEADGLMTGSPRTGPITISLPGNEEDYPAIVDLHGAGR